MNRKVIILVLACLPLNPKLWAETPIEVKVEITEVDNNKARSLGIDWVDTVAFSEGVPAGLFSLGPIDRISPLQADLHFLEQEGAAELLANPNLITDSGTTATFHAGGQIPYVTSTALGSTNVEFKPYGVLLKIKPDILESGMIRMDVQASISAPDGANGVNLSGNSVPALLEREVKSRVTVMVDTTLTLAGLVQTQKDEIIKAVPFLNKIPLLGRLFRWKKSRIRRTTIVIFVTPRLT